MSRIEVGSVVRPFYGNQHVKRWTKVKQFASLWFFRLKVATIVFAIAVVAWYLGTMQNTISVTNSIVQSQQTGIPPILQKIARAESSGLEYGSHGQVTINVNTDGSYDQGKFQINSRWNALASKMGYNLAIEKDNEAFALYLFSNYGSEPWNSSKARWNK